jgi:transcriptional regulator with XRE-family HTH domain
MPLTLGEKIKIILNRRGLTIAQLAEQTGQSRQNMSNKMSRDNFSEKELHEIANALNCTFEAAFIMNDTGEKI